MASIDGKDPLQALDVEERQRLKHLEDQVIDILLVLDATCDTVVALHEKYKQFCLSAEHDVETDEIDFIETALSEKQQDVISNRKKLETLHSKVQGTTNLVSIVITFSRIPQVLIDVLASQVIQSTGSWKWIFLERAC